MCECGCNETIPYKIFSVGDNIMVVEIYKGCEDCDTGIMVTLHLFSKEEAKELDYVPEEEFAPDKFGYSQKNFPILDRTDLVEAYNAMTGHPDTMIDALRDHYLGCALLRDAVDIRMKHNLEIARKK